MILRIPRLLVLSADKRLIRGDTVSALTLVLEDPPYGPGIDEAKVGLLVHPPTFSHPTFNRPSLHITWVHLAL